MKSTQTDKANYILIYGWDEGRCSEGDHNSAADVVDALGSLEEVRIRLDAARAVYGKANVGDESFWFRVIQGTMISAGRGAQS